MEKDKTSKVVLTALMMCLIILATMLIKIPIPFTQGYVHLGDAMIFLSVLILGWKYGIVATGVGSMLGDIIGGAAAWAPWTLVIKGGMALIMGACLKGGDSKLKEVIGMILCGRGGNVWQLGGSGNRNSVEYRPVYSWNGYCGNTFRSAAKDAGRTLFHI